MHPGMWCVQASLRNSRQDSQELWNSGASSGLLGLAEADGIEEMWLIMQYCSCGTLLVRAMA